MGIESLRRPREGTAIKMMDCESSTKGEEGAARPDGHDARTQLEVLEFLQGRSGVGGVPGTRGKLCKQSCQGDMELKERCFDQMQRSLFNYYANYFSLCGTSIFGKVSGHAGPPNSVNGVI